jgi:hypothetical protein
MIRGIVNISKKEIATEIIGPQENPLPYFNAIDIPLLH